MDTTSNKPNEEALEKLAMEIYDFLVRNKLWWDTCILYGDKEIHTESFGHADGKSYRKKDKSNPMDYVPRIRPEQHILSIVSHNSCLNRVLTSETECDVKMQDELEKIFEKYDLFYELCGWNAITASMY